MACEARGNKRAGVVVAAWDTTEIVGGDGEHVLGQPLFAARQVRIGESVGHSFRKVDFRVGHNTKFAGPRAAHGLIIPIQRPTSFCAVC